MFSGAQLSRNFIMHNMLNCYLRTRKGMEVKESRVFCPGHKLQLTSTLASAETPGYWSSAV